MMANPLQNMAQGLGQFGGLAAGQLAGTAYTTTQTMPSYQWVNQPVYYPQPPSAEVVDEKLRLIQADKYTPEDVKWLASVVTTISLERGRLLLENDALKEELKRVKNFKSWFADGKELSNDPK